MNGYYECLPHFSKIMAASEPAMHMNCKTPEEFEAWREKAEIYKIIDLQVAGLAARLEERHIGIEFTEAAKNFTVESAYDPNFGARPLKRFIRSKVETLVAKLIISDGVKAGDTVVIDREGDSLTAKVK